MQQFRGFFDLYLNKRYGVMTSKLRRSVFFTFATFISIDVIPTPNR